MKGKKIEAIMTLFIILLVSIPLVLGVLQEPYVSDEYGISIQPPQGWTIQEDGSIENVKIIVYFYGPTEDDYRVNINIIVGETQMSFQEYLYASKEEIQNLIGGPIISERSRTVKGHEAYEIVFAWTFGTYDVKQKQVYLVEKRKGYVITFTALQTNYDSYISVFDESVETFEFISGDLWWLLYLIVIGVVVVTVVAIAVYIKKRGKAEVEPEVPPPPPTSIE